MTRSGQSKERADVCKCGGTVLLWEGFRIPGALTSGLEVVEPTAICASLINILQEVMSSGKDASLCTKTTLKVIRGKGRGGGMSCHDIGDSPCGGQLGAQSSPLTMAVSLFPMRKVTTRKLL